MEKPPGLVEETEAERKNRHEELKRNLEFFVAHDDYEGLVGFVERIAHFDALTNTLNRQGFFAEAQPILERIARLPEDKDRRTGEHVSFNVLFLDLDHFKAINDTYGHSAGDAALQKIAEVLRKAFRQDDIIGRYGGEEFVGRYGGEEFVVAFTCSSKQSHIRLDPLIVAEKVRMALEKSDFTYQGHRIPFTASIGVAQMQPGDEDLETVVRRADQAMYRAKQGGRNRIAVAEEET